MNSKFFLAALGATIAIFLSGWVLYGMILMDYMREHSSMTNEPPMWAIIISNLCLGALISYIFMLGNIKGFTKGLTNGIVIGALSFLSGDIIAYGSKFFDSPTSMLADVGAGVIMCALAGGVAGWIFNMGTTEAAPAAE